MSFLIVQPIVLALALLTHASPLAERACSTRSGVTHTFYGYPDNDSPGPATAYNCGGRNNVAGGQWLSSKHFFGFLLVDVHLSTFPWRKAGYKQKDD